MHDQAVLITCEHAVNDVPAPWTTLFAGEEALLASHRGWDPGALELAAYLAEALSAPCIAARVSRLLIDHNRSPHNRFLWSEKSRPLPVEEKNRLREEYYEPFRKQATEWIEARRADGQRVVHLSVHSFAPVLDGTQRNVDIGILYDPGRPDEAYLAEIWKAHLLAIAPGLRVRFNVPYRGRSDSHIATYRDAYPSCAYAGVELEVNQALVEQGEAWRALQRQLGECLKQTLYEISRDE